MSAILSGARSRMAWACDPAGVAWPWEARPPRGLGRLVGARERGELDLIARHRVSAPEYARSKRTALATIASNTGWTSVCERLMTRRMSLVAVCVSSAVVSSRLLACSSVNSRTFSMAMTAWSAKVWSSAISSSVNAAGFAAGQRRSPRSARPSRSSGTTTRSGSHGAGDRRRSFGSRGSVSDVGDIDDGARSRSDRGVRRPRSRRHAGSSPQAASRRLARCS